jgi:hypothetical protein
MAPAMIAYLEERISHELHRLLGMRAHPFATGEKGRVHSLITQVVHDGRLIARDLLLRLTEIERKRERFFVASRPDTANCAA